jgi:chromosome segregation ATPase
MNIHATFTLIAVFALFCVSGAPSAQAAEEDTTARLREMLHRTQEALRQAQSDNSDLTRAKLEAETKLQKANKDLEAARGVSKAELVLRGQLQATKAAQDDLSRQLNDATERLSAASTKLNDNARQLAARDAELTQVKQGLEQSKSETVSCETKNLRLYTYSQELLLAYRKKGVWDSLAQRDPVLGLKEVSIENVVQEYQAKLASQRVKP